MAKVDCTELEKAIADLALSIGAQEDVTGLDDVVAQMQARFPVMPRTEIINALVNATATEGRKVDALTKKLDEIKRNARTEKATAAKIEKLEAYLDTGELPPEPKPRKAASETLQQARKTVANLQKWLKTADPAMQKALKEKLDALNQQIESGNVVVEEGREGQLHETLQALAAQVEEAQRQIADAKVIKALETRIEELQAHLEAGTMPETKDRPERGTGPADLLRSIRDDLKKELAHSEPAQKARIEAQIATLEERIAAGDFLPAAKAPELPQSKELERLAYERDRLRQTVRRAIENLKPKTIWQHIADPLNAIRALKTSFDFSAVFRQGGMIALAHPVRAAQATVDMFKAFGSERLSMKANAEIFERPNAPMYAKSGLYLAPIDGLQALGRMEEAFMSRLAEKMPGVRASERAYLTFLNRLRADSFDTMAAALGKGGEVTLEEAKALATFINEATGRGQMGMERAAVALNTVFFAPRYTVSRFQLLVGHPLWGGTNETRKLIAREYARYLMGLGTVYVLASLAGGDVEDDPRSSDFGKLRFGANTRLDPLSGLSQTIALVSKVAKGETKSTTTGEVQPIRGEDVPYGGDDTSDIIKRFLWSKLSPTFAVPTNIAAGKNVVGQKATLVGEVLGAPIPLQFQDIYEVMQEEGLAKGTALSLLSIFGMGLQVYEPRDEKKEW